PVRREEAAMGACGGSSGAAARIARRTAGMMLKPAGFFGGHRQAIAGRFTPGSLRSRSIDRAMSAPVLPQDAAAPASPVLTDSMADHIEVPLPLRTIWLGLSSIVTTP